MSAELKLYLVIFLLLLWIVTGVGGFVYRGHLDAADTKAKIDEITLAADTKVSNAENKALRDERELNTKGKVETQRLQDQIDAQKDTYERARRQLASARIPACPIPIGAIRLLMSSNPGGESHRPAPADPGPGPRASESGTVDVTAIILNAESNRLAFDREQARHKACLDRYNDVRATLNASQ